MEESTSEQKSFYRFHIVRRNADDWKITPYESPSTALATYERLVAENGIDNVRIQKEVHTSGLISPDQLRHELSKK